MASEPIAVIGVGCRFPGARNVRSLWDLLCSGRDVLGPAPEGRYVDLNEPESSRLSGLRGGFLEGIDLFDAAAFNISPREARVVDPQQRLLLETAWEALEDAGQDMRRLAGSPVGVYVGVWGSDYQARLFKASPRIDIAMTTGGGRYAAAGRLSYAFDFQGPSVTIDTACSSSLVAVHMACQALRTGECSLAIAGGANVILDSAVTIGYLSAGALSPDGRCKFGDASANGYARSEGAGVVILKTLRDALAANDPIHAIIRGGAVTHGGQTGGSLLAPGEAGQFLLLKRALAAAGLGPADLDYIEAHGAGTRVGDRAEIRALGRLLREGRTPSSRPCLIGSIKTNIGHTESAAGIAGLIKAILCLKRREVPPSLHFQKPNPEIPWDELPLRIAVERTPLQGRPAFAGVNSFGITGTFAHVILEEAPRGIAKTGHSTPAPVLLPLSARSPAALAELAGAFANQLRSSPGDPADIAFSAGLRRTHHEFRLAAVGRDAESLAAELEARGPTGDSPGEPRIGWVFSGQGPQWPGMGLQLFAAEPVFRAVIERLDGLIAAQTGWSLIKELRAPGTASKLNSTAIAQPLIFAIQVALAELLKAWGLPPAMIVGHSVGEAAAACVAGILTLEDAVRVICARARIAEKASGLGRMAAVELTVEEAREMMGGDLSLAAVNGPASLTVSGADEPLREFCDRVTARGRFCRLLDVNYPFHSALLDPLLAEMAAIGEGVSAQPPHTPLYSTVHGRLATAADFTPAYWPRNLRDTVRFAPAIRRMAADGCNVFVELSPHPALSYSIKQTLQGMPVCVVETLHREGDEPADLRRAAGELYARGCDPDWTALAPAGSPVSLPAYPWQRESYWLDERPFPKAGGLDPLLQRRLRTMGDGASYWESDISIEQFPWLEDHRADGRPVFPAAAYLLPALKAAGQLSPGAALADVEFHEALFVSTARTLQFAFRGEALTIHACDPARPELARKHVSGRMIPGGAPPPAVPRPADFAGIETPRDAVYAAMREAGLDYGPTFQGIEFIRRGDGAALARLTPPAETEGMHPATFDACIQTLVALMPGWPQAGELWMPRGVREVSWRKQPQPGASLWAWAVAGDVFLLDDAGEVLLAARGVHFQKVSRGVGRWLREVRWEPRPLQTSFMPPLADIEKRMAPAGPSPGERQAIRAASGELDRACGRSVHRALGELGFVFTPGRRFTSDDVVAETGIVPAHRRFLNRLLQILGEDGVLHRQGEYWRVERAPDREEFAGPADPGFAPLWRIFARAADNLAAVLAGRVNAVELLFGGDGAADLEQLYSANPFWRAPLRQAALAVSAIVERLPEGRMLRVLEIGAGTGGLTSRVLPLLPADRTRYVFTDLSGYFLSRAREKFTAYPFLTDKILDVERDPLAQGFAAGGFDLVLAANCLHATRGIRQALTHARRLLAPGGCLLLQEETAAERWTDLIFGMTDGWWRFEDDREHPLLSPGAWLDALGEQGFVDAAVVGNGSAIVLARQPDSPDHGRWLLLPDAGGIAQELAKYLPDCLISDSVAASDGRTAVDLRPLDAILAETDDAAALASIEERAVTSLLGVIHALADGRDSRLVLVTRGSQATGMEQAPLALAQAPLWTVARVAALEHPRLSIRRIDLDGSAPDVAALAAELLHGEGEVAFRQGARLAPRLHRLESLANEPFAFHITPDGVEARPLEPRRPAPGEVQIQVAAAGVNFRDALNVLGAVDSAPLGLECSGTVTATGDGVRDFSVGDKVIAAGLGSWRTFFNTPAALAAPKPSRLRHEQAAALPIAYLTAHYALRHAARIRPGQRVLIHSAAGGVGLAAVHMALAAGAEVFGAAGSPAKRDFLRSLGVRHVFDSRTLRFAEQIQTVDIVLNCLTGEFIPKSLGLLAEGGCFVEIGKRGIWSGSQIAERRPDVKYHVLELAEVMRTAPETLRPMLLQLAKEVEEGKLPPLPIRAFPIARAASALRYMREGLHTGKIILKTPAWDDDLAAGSWLITGGFGGLGLALAEWLVERGARNLILVGRTVPGASARAAMDGLASRGARIAAEIGDVGKEDDLRAVLERAAGLRGVFHLAGTLDDAPVRQLDWPRFATVYGPKALGAWNLHRLTRDRELDCFVLFSSWTALPGSPGQANHASANAFLDALAHHRRAQGLPAQSINWGGWREIGSAARPERLAHLARQGVGGFSPREGLEALGLILKSDAIQAGVNPFDAEKRIEETASGPQVPLREALQQAPPGLPRRQALEGCIQRRLAQVLRMPSAKFDVRKPFKSLGLDSLGSLELRNHLETDAGLKLPATLVYNHATIAALGTELAALLGVPLEINSNPADDEVTALLGALRELPEEEALRLLAQDSPQGAGR